MEQFKKKVQELFQKLGEAIGKGKERFQSMEPKKKRIVVIAVIVVFVLIVLLFSLFSGCGGGKGEKGTQKESSEKSDKKDKTTKTDKTDETKADASGEDEDPRYAKLHFRTVKPVGESSGTYTMVGSPESDAWLGDYQQQGDPDLNSYRITLSYQDLGMHHIVSYAIDTEKSQVIGYDALEYEVKNRGKYDEQLKAALKDGPADLKEFSIARHQKSGLMTILLGMIYAEEESQIPQDVEVYKRTIVPKLYYTNYTSKEDMIKHYYKNMALSNLDYYADCQEYGSKWDGEYFSDDWFEVSEEGVKQWFWMSTETSKGTREYLDFNGDPGYVDVQIAQEEAKANNPNYVYDYCDIERMIWLGGEKGACLKLRANKVPLQYQEYAMGIMAGLRLEDFSVFESEEEKKSSTVKMTALNDYVVEITYDGAVYRGDGRMKENQAGAYVSDRWGTSNNKLQYNIADQEKVYGFVIVGDTRQDYQEVGATYDWLAEKRQQGLVNTRDGKLIIAQVGRDGYGYYQGLHVLIPLPEGRVFYDKDGNKVEFLRAKFYVYSEDRITGQTISQEKAEEMLWELASKFSFQITGDLGNGEWENESYEVVWGEGSSKYN